MNATPPSPPPSQPADRSRQLVPADRSAAELAAALLRLLPAINAVTAAHHPSTRQNVACSYCTPTNPADCALISIAATALGLIIQSRRLTAVAQIPTSS